MRKAVVATAALLGGAAAIAAVTQKVTRLEAAVQEKADDHLVRGLRREFEECRARFFGLVSDDKEPEAVAA